MSAFVQIENVTLSFAGVRALDGVSLAVDQGALVAVIGPNGAGKSSLFNCISGVYRPAAGHIRLGGREITGEPSHAIAALGVARMFQNLALFDNLTVLDNLLVGRHHLYRRGFVSNLLWLPGTRREEVLHRSRVEEIIDFLHLEPYRYVPVQVLPYGVRKRVELGRALAMEPKLLLLDEPTAGLNQEETEDMARYILDIQEELHITQILIEHELRFVLDLADRVAVLDFGRKIAEGEPEEIRRHPAVIEAYIGHGGSAPQAEHKELPVAGENQAPPEEIPDTDASRKAPHASVMPVAPSVAGSQSLAHDDIAALGEAGAAPVCDWISPAAVAARLEKTLPGRLILHARQRPDAIALREKTLGIWQAITWRQYHGAVRATARMLWELGVRPGDHVAIVSDNCPEWVYADLGAQSLGARSVGIYQTNPAEDIAYVLRDSGSVVLFCEDQEQVDKAIAIAKDTPAVRRVVVFDPRGTRDMDDPRLMTWDAFLARGMELAGDDPGDNSDFFVRRVAALDPSQPAMVIYTSGTTGNPKGAMLSSDNVIEPSVALATQLGITDRDFVLSYLPLCHVAEKIFSLFLPLTTGALVHFGESIDTVQADVREVSPTVFLGVPRIWEKMHAAVTVRMQDSSWLQRTLFRYLTRKGNEISERAQAGRRSLWDRLVWLLGDLVMFRPLQERLGLRRCRLPITGAAPVAADLVRWFRGIGVMLLEGYGQTESCGVSHINPPGAMQIGTVGTTIPLVECRVDEDGEILLRGPNVFCGYLNRPDATAEVIDADGWLHSGDIGTIDENGYLTITGRKKEIIITSGGKNLSPERIENALKTSPYIKEAVAIGDKRNFVGALIQIDYDHVGKWAIRQKIPYTSYADLSKREEVVKLIDQEVEQANERLARVEQVRAFRLLAKELNQDDGEITATQKVRRRVVHELYAELIESMYQKRS